MNRVNSRKSYISADVDAVCRPALIIDQLLEREAGPVKQLFSQHSSGPLHPPSSFQVNFLFTNLIVNHCFGIHAEYSNTASKDGLSSSIFICHQMPSATKMADATAYSRPAQYIVRFVDEILRRIRQ